MVKEKRKYYLNRSRPSYTPWSKHFGALPTCFHCGFGELLENPSLDPSLFSTITQKSLFPLLSLLVEESVAFYFVFPWQISEMELSDSESLIPLCPIPLKLFPACQGAKIIPCCGNDQEDLLTMCSRVSQHCSICQIIKDRL